MGHGWPPVNKARKFGMRPSLSIDVVTTVPGDMFTQIRAAFGAERARVNAVCWDLDIPIPEDMLTATDMLKMATLDGAHVAGVEDRTGSLTPGKQADVVVIDATRDQRRADPRPGRRGHAVRRRVERRARPRRRQLRQARLQARWATWPGRCRWSRTPATTSSRRPPRPPPRSRSRTGVTDHLVRRAADLRLVRRRPARSRARPGWSGGRSSTRARRPVHTGFGLGRLAPGGRVPSHVHSYEESLYVARRAGRASRRPARRRGSGPGDYGLIPVGVPHSLRNEGDEEARFARMSAPVPRPDARLRHPAGAGPRRDRRRSPADVRDPRTRRYGHIDRGAHGPGAAVAGPAGGVGEHAHRAARLQRDHA